MIFFLNSNNNINIGQFWVFIKINHNGRTISLGKVFGGGTLIESIVIDQNHQKLVANVNNKLKANFHRNHSGSFHGLIKRGVMIFLR